MRGRGRSARLGAVSLWLLRRLVMIVRFQVAVFVGGGVARELDDFMALFVHKQLALDAFEALPTEAPYSIAAVSAKCFLK